MNGMVLLKQPHGRQVQPPHLMMLHGNLRACKISLEYCSDYHSELFVLDWPHVAWQSCFTVSKLTRFPISSFMQDYVTDRSRICTKCLGEMAQRRSMNMIPECGQLCNLTEPISSNLD